MSELWDLYDKNRNLLNKTHLRGAPIKKGEYHIVVDIWVITSDGRILIDKRHPNKRFGGMWECTGGSITSGEDSVIGALRELHEELGISASANELILIHSIRLHDRFVDTYILKKDIILDNLVLQEGEVAEARLVTLAELDEICLNNKLVVKERYKLYREKIMSHL